MSCGLALLTFAARDFTDWTGLPESCSLAEVTQHFNLADDETGSARLGDTTREFRTVTVSGYEQPVRVWLDGPQVLAMDVEYPSFPSEVSVLLKQLGEPQANLDYDWGTMPIEKGEWVYAGRGLAVFLAPDAARVFHLAVFSRTTTEGYRENFQLHLGKRLFPKR